MSKRTHNLFKFMLENLDTQYYDNIECGKFNDEIFSIHLSSVNGTTSIELFDCGSFIIVTRTGCNWRKDYELLNVNFNYYNNTIVLLMRDDFDFRLELRMK